MLLEEAISLVESEVMSTSVHTDPPAYEVACPLVVTVLSINTSAMAATL